MMDEKLNISTRFVCVGLMAGMTLALIAGATGSTQISTITFFGTIFGSSAIILGTYLVKTKKVM